MNLPPPPWRLYGWAGLLIDWIDFKDIKRHLLPDLFTPAKLFRDDTLSGHYFGCYTPVEGATFQKPFHEFGYITCMARLGRSRGFHVARMAVDHPGALLGGQRFWGVTKTEGRFEEGEGRSLRVLAEGGRVRPTVIFEKRFSLGYWEKPFQFLSLLQGRPIRYRITYHGELFYCRVKKERIWTAGKVIPLLFDSCWITLEGAEALD